MTDYRVVMEQALEALESDDEARQLQASSDLRAALAEVSVKPDTITVRLTREQHRDLMTCITVAYSGGGTLISPPKEKLLEALGDWPKT
jgi:hypothetical protein